MADPVATPLPAAATPLPAAATPLPASRQSTAAVIGTPPRVALRICPPDHERARLWGDTHFARSFAAALGRRGLPVDVHVQSEWDQPHANAHDVVIHLRGVDRYHPRPGATNVMWLISHPETVDRAELDAYDLVLVASRQYAEVVAQRTTTPVHSLLQATDTTIFGPLRTAPSLGAHGLVVVANARWPYRRAARWLMELGWDYSLYGANWDDWPERRFRAGDYVDNHQLTEIYAQADIVVADQWDDMAAKGFVANRLFDVAAAGGFVISDAGSGIDEIFGDTVPTYATRTELDALVTHYMAHPGERQRLSHRAMALVRAEHGFDVRARQLLELLDLRW